MKNMVLRGCMLAGMQVSTMEVHSGNIVTWIVALLLLMCIDYCLGMVVAQRHKKWSKKRAIDGLCKKGGILLLSGAAYIIDVVMPLIKDYIFPPNVKIDSIFQFVMAIFIVLEFRSIVKNCIRLGMNIPDILKRILFIDDLRS